MRPCRRSTRRAALRARFCRLIWGWSTRLSAITPTPGGAAPPAGRYGSAGGHGGRVARSALPQVVQGLMVVEGLTLEGLLSRGFPFYPFYPYNTEYHNGR